MANEEEEMEFTIKVVPHPIYPEVSYTALTWDGSGLGGYITYVNVDLALDEVEKTLQSYMGTKEMDNLDYLVAIKMVREWKRDNAPLVWPEDKLREIIRKERQSHKQTRYG